MPPVTNADHPNESGQIEENDDLLLNESGALTIEAEVIADFLESVDWNPLFDDPDIRPFVELEEVCLIPSNIDDENSPLIPFNEEELALFNERKGKKFGGKKNYRKMMMKPKPGEDENGEYESYVEDEDGVDYDDQDGVVRTLAETLDGEIVAEMVDIDDLTAMLEWYVNREMDAATLEERARIAAFSDLLWDDHDERLDEKAKRPFKKGDFRKGQFKGAKPGMKGPKGKIFNQRARMIMAMLKKGAIKRVGKGSGYKGGDYEYASPKGKGKPSMLKVYRRVAGKNWKRTAAIKKMVDPGRLKVVQTIYRNLGAKMPKPYVPPERRLAARMRKTGKKVKKQAAGKKGAAKKAALKKAAAKFGAKGKSVGKKLSASALTRPANLSESASIAAAVAGNLSAKDNYVTKPA